MAEAKFIINTTLSKADYKKFLYTATFKKSKMTLPYLGLMALGVAVIIGIQGNGFNFLRIVVAWAALYFFAVKFVLFRVGKSNEKRHKRAGSKAYGDPYLYEFYTDTVVIKNLRSQAQAEIFYGSMDSVKESKDFFIFYYAFNQVFLITKKDIDEQGEFKEFIRERIKGKGSRR